MIYTDDFIKETHMNPLTNEDVAYLKKLDALFTSENETVKDLIDQAIVVQAMIDPDGKAEAKFGPFQKLVFQMNNMANQIERLNHDLILLQQRIQSNHAGYWPNTIGYPQTQPTVWTTTNNIPGRWSIGSTGNVAAGGDMSQSLDPEYIKDLIANIQFGSSTRVTAADLGDPDAYSLVDPDTGDTMVVKSK